MGGSNDWIELALDRDKLCTLVNVVIKLGFHEMGISWLAEYVFISQGLCSVELVSWLVG
jgi:hypothetical protein